MVPKTATRSAVNVTPKCCTASSQPHATTSSIERVHRRDRLVAAAASAAQRDPAQDRNVLEPGQLVAALRAARARPKDRPLARPADDADVQKRPEAGAEKERVDLGESGRNGGVHRRSSKRRIPAATATFSDSTAAAIGSATRRSARARECGRQACPFIPDHERQAGWRLEIARSTRRRRPPPRSRRRVAVGTSRARPRYQ